jgi:serine/threonine protein kinase/formylglycine-generating enzyme required for sulfatase activity
VSEASQEELLFLEIGRRQGYLTEEAAEGVLERAKASGESVVEQVVADGILNVEAADAIRTLLVGLSASCSRCETVYYRSIDAPPKPTAPVLCARCSGLERRPLKDDGMSTEIVSVGGPSGPVLEENPPTEINLGTGPISGLGTGAGTGAGTGLGTGFGTGTGTGMETPGGTRTAGDTLTGGEVLGGCRLERRIGRGSMGRVYRAHHLGLDRPVAVKVLDRRLVARPGFVEQFYLEAKTLSDLGHPNVVRFFDVNHDETGRHFIIMELLPGGSVESFWTKKGRHLGLEDTLRIVTEAAKGLHHAHVHGLIHRDVKPANLMFADDGRVKVVDFGLAVPTRDDFFVATEVAGTPNYMAPEQVDGLKFDGRCDQYALGITLFQLLTGRLPFHRPKVVEILLAQLREAPPLPSSLRPDVPDWLDNIILKMLAKVPADRFESLDGFVKAIEVHHQIARPVFVPATPIRIEELTAYDYPDTPFVPRWRPALAVAAACLVAVAAFLSGVNEALGGSGRGFRPPVLTGVLKIVSSLEARSLESDRALTQALAELDDEIEDLGPDPRFARFLEDARTRFRSRLETARAKKQRALTGRVDELLQAKSFAAAMEAATAPDPDIAALGLGPYALDVRARAAAVLEHERGEVYIPAGPCRVGVAAVSVPVQGFYLDRVEVTGGAYADALARNPGLAVPLGWSTPPSHVWRLPAGAEALPVTGLSFEEASRYARSIGKRLPTSVEWEKAARGSGDARSFPWGDKFEPGRANLLDGGSGALEAVGSRQGDVSPYGVHDLAGNALEWVSGPRGALVAGGGYRSQAAAARVFERLAVSGEVRHAAIGFRCARDLEPPK